MRMPRPGSGWITRGAVYAAYMDSDAWQEKRREWYHHWVDAHGASPACLVWSAAGSGFVARQTLWRDY